MFRVSKRFIKILLGLFVCVVILGGIGLHLSYRYTSNIPKLTPKEEIFVVSPKETLDASELVDVECEGEYELQLLLVETDIMSAKVFSEHENSFYVGDSIYVGDSKGYIRLEVKGRGKKSEYGDPQEIYLMVE